MQRGQNTHPAFVGQECQEFSGAQQDNPQPLYSLMLQYMERTLTYGIKSFNKNSQLDCAPAASIYIWIDIVIYEMNVQYDVTF